MIVSSLFAFSPGAVFYRILGTHNIRTMAMLIPTGADVGLFLDITDPYLGEYHTVTLNRGELFSTKEDAVIQACKNLRNEIYKLEQQTKQDKVRQ